MTRILDRAEKAKCLGIELGGAKVSDKRLPLGRIEQIAPHEWYWLLTRSEGATEHRLQLWATHPDAFKAFRLSDDCGFGELLAGVPDPSGDYGISTSKWVEIAKRAQSRGHGPYMYMTKIQYNVMQRETHRNRGRWVSSTEAAKRLGVSKNTLIKYINDGKVRSRRIVGRGGWSYQVDLSASPVQAAMPITEAPVEPLIAPRVTFVEPTPAAVPAPAPTAPANPTIAMIVRLFERLDTATQADTLQRLMEIAYP